MNASLTLGLWMMEGKTQSESKGRGRQHSTSAAHLGGTDLET